MLGFVMIGTLAGGTAAISALVLGSGIGIALLAYVGCGVAGLGLGVVFSLTATARQALRSNQMAPLPDMQ